MTALQRSILALIDKASDNEVEDPCFGICFNLQDIYDEGEGGGLIDVYQFVADESASYAGFSGNPLFPIPHTQGFGLWEGPHLTHRLALLEHLLRAAVAQGL